ncbi:MAG: chaperone modulatory protein CbpM [Oceanicoccus sp.]|uniref:chaperone modulator CbpM n=1 Tax=Oceanicoccus sp. TaxID=2691044 RepID=UPI0026302774|nr:chaperone modulator CbpM [Oceanicoccus sp.]MCP3908703.1 chaperone modulatory protein CbpM [Oceanicoccus sp.]MDG1772475.1 chaperone modulator CbpM [Oceanicoccus sp.]
MQFSLENFCQVTELPTKIVIDIVEEGIVEPRGESPDTWLFDRKMASIAEKAFRLHRDLDIEWAGIALAISLLEELEQVRAENQQLQRLLRRYVDRRL